MAIICSPKPHWNGSRELIHDTAPIHETMNVCQYVCVCVFDLLEIWTDWSVLKWGVRWCLFNYCLANYIDLVRFFSVKYNLTLNNIETSWNIIDIRCSCGMRASNDINKFYGNKRVCVCFLKESGKFRIRHWCYCVLPVVSNSFSSRNLPRDCLAWGSHW